MTLHDCAPGVRVRLGRLRLPGHDRLRLSGLGFLPGHEIRVVGRGAAGGLVVALGDARYAVDADTARRIRVTAPVDADV
ncbi:ferrous iron transport protein A [Streptomyces luteireticuli]|uniref:FeoA family protein n=1 Tax=Streptomyces luteireticuli TaxID=173858 RepID=UPI0035572EAF